jgi:hypothetical protein
MRPQRIAVTFWASLVLLALVCPLVISGCSRGNDADKQAIDRERQDLQRERDQLQKERERLSQNNAPGSHPATPPTASPGTQTERYSQDSPAAHNQTAAPPADEGTAISAAALEIVDDWVQRSWNPQRAVEWRRVDRYSVTGEGQAVAYVSFRFGACLDENGNRVEASTQSSKVSLRKYNTGWSVESYDTPWGEIRRF